MIFNIVHISCTVAWTVAFAYKFRHLRANWGSPRLWATCTVILSSSVATGVGSPAAQGWINRAIGIPNIAQPIIACNASAAAAAVVTLALSWRYPIRTAWHRARWVIAAYTLNLAVMLVLFGVSEVPEEHTLYQEFVDHYVPQQPTVFVYQLLFYTPIVAGVVVTACWCFSWARREEYAGIPWLRRALSLYAWCCSCTAVSMTAQLVTVIAAKFRMHAFDTAVEVIHLASTLVTLFLLPAALLVSTWGPRWPAVRAWFAKYRAFFILLPLHRRLRQVSPANVVVASRRRRDPHHRVRRMMIELSDWRWILAPLFDPALGERTERAGRAAGLGGERLRAEVEAAQLKSAVEAWKSGVRHSRGTPAGEEEARNGIGVDTEIAWWVQVARAFRKPCVTVGTTSGAQPELTETTGQDTVSPGPGGRRPALWDRT